MTVLNYAVACKAGAESNVAKSIMNAAKRCCKTIINAIATPFAGYVEITVIAEEGSCIKETSLKLPHAAKMVIEMVPGVIRVCGNGDEPVSIQ